MSIKKGVLEIILDQIEVIFINDKKPSILNFKSLFESVMIVEILQPNGIDFCSLQKGKQIQMKSQKVFTKFEKKFIRIINKQLICRFIE